MPENPVSRHFIPPSLTTGFVILALWSVCVSCPSISQRLWSITPHSRTNRRLRGRNKCLIGHTHDQYQHKLQLTSILARSKLFITVCFCLSNSFPNSRFLADSKDQQFVRERLCLGSPSTRNKAFLPLLCATANLIFTVVFELDPPLQVCKLIPMIARRANQTGGKGRSHISLVTMNIRNFCDPSVEIFCWSEMCNKCSRITQARSTQVWHIDRFRESPTHEC